MQTGSTPQLPRKSFYSAFCASSQHCLKSSSALILFPLGELDEDTNQQRQYNEYIPLLFPVPFVEMLGNGRTEKCVPVVDFPDSRAHGVSGGLLDEIPHRADIHGLDDIRIIAVRRKHEHLGGRRAALRSQQWHDFKNLAGGLQTIEQRHGHVHQHQVGTKSFRHGDRLEAVFGLADHFKIVLEFQYPSEFPAHVSVVIRQEDSDLLHDWYYVTSIDAYLALVSCIRCQSVYGANTPSLNGHCNGCMR